MKIVSLNKNSEDYGYPMAMDLKRKGFHGHQTACAIGLKRADGTWEMLYTPGDTKEEKIKVAEDMLNDESLLIVEQKLIEVENGVSIPKAMYFLPYYVENHCAFKPTVNFAQMSKDTETKIEVLFVNKEGWYNRYVVFKSTNNSLMEFIDNLGSKIMESVENNKDFFKDKDSIALDFYDESGHKTIVSGNIDYFLSMVSSVRVVDVKPRIIKED